MKPYENDDELERALFALELEEPPADLRASILAGTIYRQPVPVKGWEVWLLGAVCALLAWVAVFAGSGRNLPGIASAASHFQTALTILARPDMLLWTAAGAGLVLWVSQLNLTVAPGALRATRR